jgi:outer membrane protein assembly factor BamB
VRAIDSAGNVDRTPATSSWTIDSIPPETTITSYPQNPTNSTSATFEFTCDEGNCVFECKLDNGAYSSCSSPKTFINLSEGLHIFYVRTKDSAGNTDPTPAIYSWTIDITPPETTITSQPPNPSNSTLSVFEFTCNEEPCTFECHLDNGGWLSCTSPKIYSGLSDGSHTFEVRAIDSAGNIDKTPATYSWTIDSIPPETTITSCPQNPTNSTSATFEFICNEESCTFECKIDNGFWESCASPNTFTNLSEGSHTFYVRAKDSAGNTDPTPASYSWTIDITPPETTITSQPPNPSNSSNATFGFVCNEPSCTFECQLDGGGWTLCISPKTYTGLFDGTHVFEVKAIDAGGNVDPTPATYSWAITLPPTLLWSYMTGNQVDGHPSLGDIDNDGKIEVVVGSVDYKIYAINGENGSLLWSYKTGGAVYSSPSLGDIDNDGKLEVVVGSLDYKIYALNGEDGSLLWSYGTGNYVFSVPSFGDIDNDGKLEVVVGSNDDKIYAINGENGSLLWSYTTGGDVHSSPSLGDIDNDGKLEVVVGSSDYKIYALNGEDGSLLWSWTTGGMVISSPSLGDIDNDGKLEVVVGSWDYKLYALNGENGSLLWSYTAGNGVDSNPSLGDIDNDGKLEVVVGCRDSKVYALNGENGSLLWSYITGSSNTSSPSLGDINNDGKLEVIIGSFDNKIYALNGDDGSLLWTYTTGNEIHSAPAIGDIDNDGKLEVVVGSYDYKIYAISTNSPVPSPSLLPWPEFGNRGYNRTRNLDSWEINDSILTPANIIDLVRNGAIPGYIWKSGDVDFYSFPVTQAPSTIKLELKDIPSGTNYDLYLYDTNKNLVSSSTNSGNSPEAITYSTTVPGTYYIKVDSSYGYSPTKPYSLYIKIEK